MLEYSLCLYERYCHSGPMNCGHIECFDTILKQEKMHKKEHIILLKLNMHIFCKSVLLV